MSHLSHLASESWCFVPQAVPLNVHETERAGTMQMYLDLHLYWHNIRKLAPKAFDIFYGQQPSQIVGGSTSGFTSTQLPYLLRFAYKFSYLRFSQFGNYSDLYVNKEGSYRAQYPQSSPCFFVLFRELTPALETACPLVIIPNSTSSRKRPRSAALRQHNAESITRQSLHGAIGGPKSR